ncbi:MAG TPA: ligand-binding protein SH3 [Firmicutes bacterium]|nr:ligand-binding protein SH3 [Bacillota bacterium]
MEFKIIKSHVCDNPYPLNVKLGEKVRVGSKSSIEDGWENWVYCYQVNGLGEGWAPMQLIRIEGMFGTVTEDYSAQELNVCYGEVVRGEKELNGWIWCKCELRNGEVGWLPIENLMRLE